MNTNKIRISGSMAAVLAVTAAIGFAAASCNEKKDVSQQSSESSVTTNDNGSVSRIKGFVTNAVQALVDRGENIAQITAIGPVIMMKSVAEATRPYGIPTVVSLNPIMVDGTGMCGGCRVTVGDETKFLRRWTSRMSARFAGSAMRRSPTMASLLGRLRFRCLCCVRRRLKAVRKSSSAATLSGANMSVSARGTT